MTSLTSRDEAALSEIKAKRRTFSPSADIVVEGEPFHALPLLVEGWAAQYHVMHDGRRSILKLNLKGDVIDGAFPLLHRARYSAQALTDCAVLLYPTKTLANLLEQNAHLALAFLLLEVHQNDLLRERVMTLSRLSAYERLGHLCLELLTRLEAVGLAANDSFPMPLSQPILGDVLGMHEVHVNRMLHRLEADGYILRGNGRIQVLEREALAEMVEFRPSERA